MALTLTQAIYSGRCRPHALFRDFAKKIYHVHIKDCYVKLDGRAGILGSHIKFGDLRRGWNFVSHGHGDVDFEKIIREANIAQYCTLLEYSLDPTLQIPQFAVQYNFTNTKNKQYL